MMRAKGSGVSQQRNKKGDSSENKSEAEGDSGYDGGGDDDGDGDGLNVGRGFRGRRRQQVKVRVKGREGGIAGGSVGTRGSEVAERYGDGGGGGDARMSVCAVLMRYLGFRMGVEGWVRR